jgi:hypothetical protein
MPQPHHHPDDALFEAPDIEPPVIGSISCGDTDQLGYCPASITSPVRPEWQPCAVGDYQVGALTKKQRTLLSVLGLAIVVFEWFRDHFSGDLWNYARRLHGGEWSSAQPTWRLSNSQLINHLKGRYDLATYCRRVARLAGKSRYATDRFVVDLDFHSDPTDLYARYDAVTAVFGVPTLLFRSSSSRGLHLHYWLDRHVDLQRLSSADGQRGMLHRLLKASGLHAESGRIELYPQASYRNLPRGNRLRVPFGADSRLLDPVSLEPFNSASGERPVNIADLRLVRERVVAGEVEPVSFDALFAASMSKATDAPAPRSPSRRSGRAEPEHGGPSAALLLREGLTGSGQLDSAIGSLGYHCLRERQDVETAIRTIQLWLAHKHNGHSSTFNRNSRSTDAIIRDRVVRIYGKSGGRPSREWAPLPGLSGGEASRLLAVTAESCDKATGEVVELYAFQRMCFQIANGAKQWVITEGQSVWNSLINTNPTLATDGEQFARLLLARCLRFWPNPATATFIVDMPYEHRLRRGGLSRGRLTPMWRAAQSTGLFRLMRKASPDLHRCEAFGVELDFSAFETTAVFDSVDHMLVRELSRKERHRRYTNYRCKQLARVERSLVDMRSLGGSVTAFERFIRCQLVAASKLTLKDKEAA